MTEELNTEEENASGNNSTNGQKDTPTRVSLIHLAQDKDSKIRRQRTTEEGQIDLISKVKMKESKISSLSDEVRVCPTDP